MLTVHTLVLGNITTNSYIVVNEHNECIIIDCDGDVAIYQQFFEKHHITPSHLLLTHGHFDHIGCAEELREYYGLKIVSSKKETPILANKDLNLSKMMQTSLQLIPDITYEDEETFIINHFEIQLLLTPGHTLGSCVYLIEDCMFSGDTLFYESYGRFDFPSGNKEAIYQSIHRLLRLEKDYTVYPGHGEITTLSHEKKFNPFS